MPKNKEEPASETSETNASEDSPAKKKIKFKRKKELSIEDVISDVVSSVDDVWVPDGKCEDICYQVKDWIKAPEIFCELMGTPGIPCGHYIQVQGRSDTGKTTFCIHEMVECQRDGGLVIFIDTEHKFDIRRAVKMGLDRNRMLWYKPKTIEECFEKLVEVLNRIREKNPNLKILIVWDSLGAAPCNREVDESQEDYAPAAAKAIKAGLRRTRYFLHQMNAAFIIVNHFYTRTDLRGPGAAFADKDRAYGGEGPTYYSSIILKFKYREKLNKKNKDGIKRIGTVSTVEVMKNHIGVPFRKVQIEIDEMGIRG
jgi:recombination protein RecA